LLQILTEHGSYKQRKAAYLLYSTESTQSLSVASMGRGALGPQSPGLGTEMREPSTATTAAAELLPAAAAA